MKERFKYWFDCTIARGTPSMILWLSIISLFIVTCCSLFLLVLLQLKGDSEITYLESFWKTLNAALDPGLVATEVRWLERIFLLLVTFFGLFIVSTLIGVIGSGVQDKIMELRRGRSIVLESSHVVILGWSTKIDVVIGELIMANESKGYVTIVILAPRDKVEMEEYLMLRLGRRACRNVVCRSGDPSIPNDLKIVRPHLAKSILLLSFDKSRNDAVILKRAMALQRMLGEADVSFIPVVAEVHDPENSLAVRSTGDVRVILPVEFITRVLVQVAREPGLSLVYEELFSFEGNEIYLNQESCYVGKTFGEIFLSMPNSCPIGIRDKDGVTELNPDPGRVLLNGEQLAIVAEDDSLILPPDFSKEFKHKVFSSNQEQGHEKIDSMNLVIFGWHQSGHVLINELDPQLPKGSTIHLVFDPRYIEEDLSKLPEKMHKNTLSIEHADTSSIQFLSTLKLDEIDEVIILGYRATLDAQDADSITLMTLVHLRSLAEQAKTEFGIATELLDASNRDVAKRDKSEDFIASEELVSRAIVQLMENPELETIFRELLTEEGPEVHLRSTVSYQCIGQDITFGSISRMSMEKKELAIGLAFREERDSELTVKLAPEKSEIFNLGKYDLIVVLAEE
jgi:voltage-gated potassium channel Kch